MKKLFVLLAALTLSLSSAAFAQGTQRDLSGVVLNEKDEVVQNATVVVRTATTVQTAYTNSQGQFVVRIPSGVSVTVEIGGPYISKTIRSLQANDFSENMSFHVRYLIPKVHDNIVITATAVEPEIERRNDAVYKETLFSRDDQIFDTLAAGINAGQHEGGGKSIEVRRFGFNLDHGGVNGGLKVLVDDVQQNQSTQGHGQGYLGQLKSLTPELVDDVDILNGPFSAEYGDFSGLGVVHIRLKERMADRFTARLQGGSFDALRGFFGYSPQWEKTDSFIAYEGAFTNGPFKNPLNYLRHNVTANLTRHLDEHQSLGFRFNFGTNTFDSSGQIPFDQVQSGALERFGFVDPSDGGRVRSGTFATYFKRDLANGDIFKLDGFLARSLFDLWSNFTFYLKDPVNGDEIQQHDSRLQEGVNSQYLHAWKLVGRSALLTVGGNFHDNQINVGLFPTKDRIYLGPGAANPTTSADAHVTNGAGYIQQAVELIPQKLHVELGMRYDYFHFDVADRVTPTDNGTAGQGQWQPKASLAYTPSLRVPLTVHASYGRGISSQDARGIVQNPGAPKVATTDFYQVGTSHQLKRFSLSTDLFLIDRSNEQVYVPDDGSLEFKGPSRSYGWEAKTSAQLTKVLSFNAGITQVSNAFYRATHPTLYIDSAPHTVGDAGFTLAGWHGAYASLRYRHIGGYRLDGLDPTIHASGLDVIDLSATKAIRHGVEMNFAIENLTNKKYWETQNYFESRLTPEAPALFRIHATPGYPVGVTVGITWRGE